MIKESEPILNPDGSIHHLNLRPEQVADTIILVGDPNHVPRVSAYFDTIEFSTQKREFYTHTDTYKGKHLTAFSTGIGPDNIDIVTNELDALFNIDLHTHKPREQLASLNIVRFGTSGSLQADIPVDSFVLSSHGLGTSNMLHAYKDTPNVREVAVGEALMAHTQWNIDKGRPYIVGCGETLRQRLSTDKVFEGIMDTAPGFYGPQGRMLRLPVQDPIPNDKLYSFNYKGYRVTDLEMETSTIYGLSKLLGHQAVSLNAIIANHAAGIFTKDIKGVVENLIVYGLERLAKK